MSKFQLKNFFKELKLIYFSSPFDETAVDLLESLDTPAYKIASFEVVDLPLIRYVAGTGKPIIMSTGMASEEEIEEAITAAREAGCRDLLLLHCISSYPTTAAESNLNNILTLKKEFNVEVGLSDHTTDNLACYSGIALGADLLERHFTDDMQRTGPDIICSMNPESLSDLIRGSKIIFEANGGEKEPVKEENPTIAFAFASVVAIKDIYPGELLNKNNIWLKRPGGGDFNANNYESLMGKKCLEFIKNGYQIKKSQVDC